MLNNNRFYELMDERGVKTISELSRLTKIPCSTLNYMLQGHDMFVSNLVELALFFEVPLEELICTSKEIVSYTDNKVIHTGTTNFIEATVSTMM
jgi:hypothetical protein